MNRPYEGMNAILYARVSTDDKGQNPKQQIEDMEQWCKNQGVSILARYIDEGKTGANMDRPGMLQVMGRVMMGGVGMVIAQHPDRISRDAADGEAFRKALKNHGVVLRYTTMDFSLDTHIGRTLNYASSSSGEQWLADHSVKVMKGMRYAQTHGTKSGRPIGRPVAEIDLDLAVECSARGYSMAKTAKLLGCPRPTLIAHLTRTGRMQEFKIACQKGILSDKSDSLNTNPENKGE